MTRRRVAVVGGGIAGLVTAFRLATSGADLEIRLFEASSRLGGQLRTIEFAGRRVDVGARSFAEDETVMQLTHDLGIDHLVEPPRDLITQLWTRDRFRQLPPGLIDGVPTSLWQLATSGIVSWRGVVRAGLDLVLPDDWPGHDEPVAELIERRLGSEVAAKLVDPIIGSANAANTADLSSSLATPAIAEAARLDRSLLKGLGRIEKRSAGSDRRQVRGFRGGMSVLTERLASALDGVEIVTSCPVSVDADGGRYAVRSRNSVWQADSVVLACPAPATAAMLAPWAPASAKHSAQFSSTSLVVTTLAIGPEDLRADDPERGRLLFGSDEILATSVEFEDARPEEPFVLHVTSGRAGDDRAMQLDDDELVDALVGQLAPMLGFEGPILEWQVTRWADRVPQYPPGHGERVTALEVALRHEAPGLFVTGASYRGAGVSACVRHASETADAVLDTIRAGA